MEDLSAFPHKTMEHRNGKIEIYFTSLNTIETRFDQLSANRVKYSGFMRFSRDGYGYFKAQFDASSKNIDTNSYEVCRCDNNAKAEVKGINRMAEIITETSYGFIKQYPQLLEEADKLMRKKEINRLGDKLDKATSEKKWQLFDKIEARIFTLSLEQKTAPFKYITDKELGIE